MEDVNLGTLDGLRRTEVGWVTVSLLFVFGTATNRLSSMTVPSGGGSGVHWANEQKFMVFTMRMCSNHGCLRGSGDVSTGSTTLIPDSSSSENFQTISL